MHSRVNPAIVLFAPTASGKSALAMGLAQALNGVVINMDSRQVYRHMPLLTACPTAEEYAAAPHVLYEVLEPTVISSAGAYVAAARQAAETAWANGQVPIFVGGTGLYADVLLHGLSPIPEIPAEIVKHWQSRVEQEGAAVLHAELAKVDAPWAAQITVNDSQRIARGLSVWQATGQRFSDWQQQPRAGGLAANMLPLAIHRPRAEILARLAQRFDHIYAHGLMAEVAALREKNYALTLPALTSLGLAELYQHLDGTLDKSAIREAFLTRQRQYAKRQATWLRQTYPAQQVWEQPTPAEALTFVQQWLDNHA
ncbi:MAG: tRNA (adenosine(37)-N6)-dimethylallyltransferase MiaA [Alphaproteobacteria bacterium]